jgi:hypothetical protein
MSDLASITILAIDRDENQALFDWSRGLDWVRWLLSDIRSQIPPPTQDPGGLEDAAAVLHHWQAFAREVFLPLIGPALSRCWLAAHHGRTRELSQLALELDQTLPPHLSERSTQAAELLLRGTRHAAFQETLGKHRAAILEGRCPAHFAPVWAATGVLFQLGLANICAEYLRLEWSILTRHCYDLAEPSGADSIVELARQIVHGSGHALRMVEEPTDDDLRREG